MLKFDEQKNIYIYCIKVLVLGSLHKGSDIHASGVVVDSIDQWVVFVVGSCYFEFQ